MAEKRLLKVLQILINNQNTKQANIEIINNMGANLLGSEFDSKLVDLELLVKKKSIQYQKSLLCPKQPSIPFPCEKIEHEWRQIQKQIRESGVNKNSFWQQKLDMLIGRYYIGGTKYQEQYKKNNLIGKIVQPLPQLSLSYRKSDKEPKSSLISKMNLQN